MATYEIFLAQFLAHNFSKDVCFCYQVQACSAHYISSSWCWILGRGAWHGTQNPHSYGRTSETYLFSNLFFAHTTGYRIYYIASPHLLPASFWFLLYVFSRRRSFPVGSSLFRWWLFCRYLWCWCAHERRWVQGFSTHPSWLLFKWKF